MVEAAALDAIEQRCAAHAVDRQAIKWPKKLYKGSTPARPPMLGESRVSIIAVPQNPLPTLPTPHVEQEDGHVAILVPLAGIERDAVNVAVEDAQLLATISGYRKHVFRHVDWFNGAVHRIDNIHTCVHAG